MARRIKALRPPPWENQFDWCRWLDDVEEKGNLALGPSNTECGEFEYFDDGEGDACLSATMTSLGLDGDIIKTPEKVYQRPPSTAASSSSSSSSSFTTTVKSTTTTTTTLQGGGSVSASSKVFRKLATDRKLAADLELGTSTADKTLKRLLSQINATHAAFMMGDGGGGRDGAESTESISTTTAAPTGVALGSKKKRSRSKPPTRTTPPINSTKRLKKSVDNSATSTNTTTTMSNTTATTTTTSTETREKQVKRIDVVDLSMSTDDEGVEKSSSSGGSEDDDDKYFGVVAHKNALRWHTQVRTPSGGRVIITQFRTPREAAKAVDQIMIALYGRNARRLNFPEKKEKYLKGGGIEDYIIERIENEGLLCPEVKKAIMAKNVV